MMKNILLLTVMAGVFGFWTKSLYAQFGGVSVDAIDNPVVIELFTSQSCSSCPPADKNLAELSENPNVIALGFHVTYWNHLHWKDTLSRKFATERQRAYANYKRSRRVYTPQMVVNGGEEFVGSRGGDIQKSLGRAKDIQVIAIEKLESGLSVTLPEVAKGAYTLWLAGVKDTHTQSIPSGENRGRTVEYHNAVLSYEKVGLWMGQARTLTLPVDKVSEIDRYVVLAQKDDYGDIIAAGQMR